MERAAFWSLIEQTCRINWTEAAREEYLVHALEEQDLTGILDFAQHLDELREAADTWQMWGAATIIHNGWCSDDSFFYYQMWLITLGPDLFERAISDPDTLAEVPLLQRLATMKTEDWEEDEWPEWEGLDYVADSALESITDGEKSVDELLEERGYEASSTPDPQDASFDLADPEVMSARYPRLWALFNQRALFSQPQ